MQKDPFPFYRRLREDFPVHRDPEGYWVLTRHADIVAALRNHTVFSSSLGVGPGRVPGTTILDTDPPEHTRLRGLAAKTFLPGSVEQLAERMESIAHRLIDESAGERGTFDLVEDFAIPLPLKVIATILGMDPENYRQYRRWTQASIAFLGRPDSASSQVNYMACSREFGDYLTKLSLQRARVPQADLISLFLKARRETTGETPAVPKLSPIEYVLNIEMFLAAGSETTSALIGNAAPLLAAHPGYVQDARRDPSLLSPLLEECLRMEAPFQGDFRTTTQPVTLHGVEIPAGAKVVLMFGSANRDPAVFPDPERFDPTRASSPHLAFGHGIHHCIGAPLARLEARIAAKVLAQRFRMLAPDPAQPAVRSKTSPLFRSHARMPMQFQFSS